MIKLTTGVKPEEKPEMKHKLLVSILNFLSLAIRGSLAQSKATFFSPRVPKVPKEKPIDPPKVIARTQYEDLDFISPKLICSPWARLQQNFGSSLAPHVFLNPVW